MGCWLSKKIEQQQQQQTVEDKVPKVQELLNTNIQNVQEQIKESILVSLIADQLVRVKEKKEKRKSYIGNLLAQSKNIPIIQNRFTKIQRQHIAIISSEEKLKPPQNAIKVILQDKLDSVRQFIEQNGQSFTACSICTLTYNLSDRQPKMICMNQHTICSQCVQQLWSKGIKKCPFDKRQFDIENVKKNRIIIEFMQQQQKHRQKSQ